MFEDTPVNVGVASWPGSARGFLAVRRMQTKLHGWATQDSGRRFDDLYNLVYDPAFLTIAWERVAGNKGSRTPGIDRVSVSQITSRIGVETFLGDVRDQLRSGTFHPAPVRQVMIPKKNKKLRGLGIPVITDRVVQAALKLVLEPIFEADFLPCSYGFRPNRRAQDAISEIQHFTTRSYRWVLDADISGCFDNISHTALMDRVRHRIKDKRILALVKAFLKAGVMTTSGLIMETHTGTPQGGILSPLLANVALSVLDEHFMGQWDTDMATVTQRARRRRHNQANWRLVRYCDDFVILVDGDHTDVDQIRQETIDVLSPMGLQLSPEKTRIVHVDEGFDFLGFNVRRMRKRGTSKYYIYTCPSKTAVATIKQRIKTSTYRSTRHLDPGYVLEHLGMMLRGWANYFRHGVSKTIFSKIDEYAWARITNWLRKKHHIGWPELKRRYYVTGTWLLICDGRKFRGAASVPVTRYHYRGYHIPNPWNQQPSAAIG